MDGDELLQKSLPVNNVHVLQNRQPIETRQIKPLIQARINIESAQTREKHLQALAKKHDNLLEKARITAAAAAAEVGDQMRAESAAGALRPNHVYGNGHWRS